MGIDNRDYYRDSDDGAGGSGLFHSHELPTHSICFKLIMINVIVFLLQIFSTREMTEADLRSQLQRVHQDDPNSVSISADDQTDHVVEITERALFRAPRISVITEWLSLDTDKVLHGQVWRVLTCAFCHDRESVSHILFNMLFLWWFGKTLEVMYGQREFLLFYVSAALLSSLAFMALALATGTGGSMIGASGAVMATMMLYAIHYPRQTIMIFWVFPLEIRWLVLFYVIFDLFPVLKMLSGDSLLTGVAHAAHLGGFVFGWLYWKLAWRLESCLARLPQPRLWWKRTVGPQRHFKVVRPDDDTLQSSLSFEDQLDAVLAKLHEQGRAALTEAELKVLEEGSQRYRTRRGL